MAKYMDGNTGSGSTAAGIAGFGGVAQSIPILNVLAPGITAGLANDGEQQIRDAILWNAQHQDMPTLGGQYQQSAYTGDLAPDMYGTPEEAKYQLAQMDPQTLAARRAAIDRLADEGTGAAAAQAEADRRRALYDSANQAGAQSAGLREEMAARGKGGAGMELAMRQRAGQSGANQAMLGGLQAQANGQAQRLAALNAYEQSLGGLSDDQQSLSTGNAGIVNQFNMANTNLRNRIAMANTDLRNGAQQRNLDARQTSVNNNTGVKNANVDLLNKTKQQTFVNESKRLSDIQNALIGKAQQFRDANKDAEESGKTGASNFSSLMGGMGGGMGFMGGK